MIEHAPHSLEGAAAMAALMQPGCWKHAGMAGVVTGIDLDGAFSRIDPGGADTVIARRIAGMGEAGLISGSARRTGRRGSE